MNLTRKFRDLRFPEAVIRRATSVMESMPRSDKSPEFKLLQVSMGDEGWDLDNVEDFFARFSSADGLVFAYDVPLATPYWSCIMSYSWSLGSGASVTVSSEHAHQINSVMNVFKESLDLATKIERTDKESGDGMESEFNIFIGHGRSRAWEDLRNHLQDKHSFKVISFESGARAGHQIRDILDEMLDRSSLAFLVLTGEDETGDHRMRARQNVIHETGLFQGRLGFPRAIVLLEDGVEQFSNLAGIQYIPFTKDHINGTFGEVLAVIKREIELPATRRYQPVKMRGRGPSGSEIIQRDRGRL